MQDKEFKKELSGVCAALSAFMALPSLASYLLSALLMCFGALMIRNGGDLNASLLFINDPENIYGQLVNFFYYIFVFAPIPIYAAIKGRKFREIVICGKPKAWQLFSAIFITFSCAVCFDLVAEVIESIFESAGLNPSFPGKNLPQDPACAVIYAISLAVLPALIEEFCFRGVCLTEFAKKSPKFALFFSSLCFSFMHATVQQIPRTFFIGILIGYFVVKFGSFRIGVIIHFLNNLNYLIGEIIMDQFGSLSYAYFTYTVASIVVLLGIVFSFLFFKKVKRPLYFGEEKIKFLGAFGMLLKTPLFYLFVIICVGKTIMNYIGI